MAGEARQILAQNLRLLRFHRRWSQETLGFEAGLHRTYISQIALLLRILRPRHWAIPGRQKGQIEHLYRQHRTPRAFPHVVHSKKLAHALGLTVSELLRPPNGRFDHNDGKPHKP